MVTEKEEGPYRLRFKLLRSKTEEKKNVDGWGVRGITLYSTTVLPNLY